MSPEQKRAMYTLFSYRFESRWLGHVCRWSVARDQVPESSLRAAAIYVIGWGC